MIVIPLNICLSCIMSIGSRLVTANMRHLTQRERRGLFRFVETEALPATGKRATPARG